MNADEYTRQELQLDVGDGHNIYVHDWGQGNSTPVVYLHGGPGGKVSDSKKSFFEPSKQRVLFFDQRGCGRSTPYGSLEHNTTSHLVLDIIKILDKLEIKRAVLFGGSWGSALALYTALQHPERVAALVLYGIFTATKWENEWIDSGMTRHFYPELWAQYMASVPAEHTANPTAYHAPRILAETPDKQSALAYQRYQSGLVFLDDRNGRFEADDEYDPAPVRIETHYLSQGAFMPEGYILEHAAAITMPVYMVQGRYDMMCPPVTAYKLAEKLPNATLHWTVDGHVAGRETWSLLRALTSQAIAASDGLKHA